MKWGGVAAAEENPFAARAPAAAGGHMWADVESLSANLHRHVLKAIHTSTAVVQHVPMAGGGRLMTPPPTYG